MRNSDSMLPPLFVWNLISKRICLQQKEKRKIQYSTRSALVLYLIYKLFDKHGCAIAKNTLKQKDCQCFLSLWGLNSWDPLSGTSYPLATVGAIPGGILVHKVLLNTDGEFVWFVPRWEETVSEQGGNVSQCVWDTLLCTGNLGWGPLLPRARREKRPIPTFPGCLLSAHTPGLLISLERREEAF